MRFVERDWRAVGKMGNMVKIGCFGGSFGTNLGPLFIWSQKNSFHWFRILSLLLESRQIKISAYENGFQSCRGAIDLQEQDSM